MENKTARFLGPDYTWDQTRIELRDARPPDGHLHLLLPSFTAYQMFVTYSTGAGKVTKYKLSLGWDEKKKLCELFVTHDFVAIPSQVVTAERSEPISTITLTSARRENYTVSRSASAAKSHPQFNAIYQALLELVSRTSGQRPMPRRLEDWEKWLLTTALIATLALVAVLAYFPARAIVEAWWPARFGLLFGAHTVLMALFLGLLVLLGRWERRKMLWDRTFTNPFMLAATNLFFFVGLVGATGLLEEVVAIWRGATVPQVGDERVLYGVLAYSGVIAAWLTLLGALLVGKWLTSWLDERF